MSDGPSYFSHSIRLFYGDSVGGYIKRFFLPVGKYFEEKSVILYFFLFSHVLICPSNIYYCYAVRTSFHFETLFSTQPINIVVEEISRNKSVVQTTITYFINQKEKHVSFRHNSILTLMKSGAPFLSIDIIYMIYLDVKYFSVVYFSIYYEKFAVKTALTTMRRFFSKKLNYCPFDIICNSIAIKCQCLKHNLKFLICIFCISNKS